MIIEIVGRVVLDVWHTLVGTWSVLLVSVAAAAGLTVYVGAERLGGWMHRRAGVAVAGAVVLAAATPFCSCGTMAVTLGMLAATSPWAPIVAFLVASPLTSPSELLLSAGLLGWPFALVFFVGTIGLGLAAGLVAAAADRAGLLDGQARMVPTTVPVAALPVVSPGPGAAAAVELQPWWRRRRLDRFGREFLAAGRRLGMYFLLFTSLGYLVVETIPTTWLQSWLGGDSPIAVVGAALIGIPAYVNTEGSLPLVAALMRGGMGPGAAMAFMVTGAGTSLGALSGLLVVARGRVIALVLGVLFLGAIGLGFATDLLLG